VESPYTYSPIPEVETAADFDTWAMMLPPFQTMPAASANSKRRRMTCAESVLMPQERTGR